MYLIRQPVTQKLIRAKSDLVSQEIQSLGNCVALIKRSDHTVSKEIQSLPGDSVARMLNVLSIPRDSHF